MKPSLLTEITIISYNLDDLLRKGFLKELEEVEIKKP
jgi:hypothetical protein